MRPLLKVVPDAKNLIRYWDPLYLQALIIDLGSDPDPDGSGQPSVEIPKRIFDRAAAILVSHGHFDHWALISKKPVGLPIYVTPVVQIFLEQQARDFEDWAKLRPILRETRIFLPGSPIRVGKMLVETIPLSHSTPESVAFLFTLGSERTLHLGEFKFESRNPAFRPAFEARLAEIGRQGLETLVLDVQNIANDCFSPSEEVVINGITPLIAGAPGRVIISSFGSNVERVGELMKVARTLHRPVSFLGAGMRKAMAVLGVESNPVIDHPHAVLFVSGCQGEENSTLLRASCRDHQDLHLRRNDRVILSTRCIPGNEERMRELCANLLALRVELFVHEGETRKLGIEAKEAATHATGHASLRDVKLALVELLRPKKVFARPSDPDIQQAFWELVHETSPGMTVLSEEELLFSR